MKTVHKRKNKKSFPKKSFRKNLKLKKKVKTRAFHKTQKTGLEIINLSKFIEKELSKGIKKDIVFNKLKKVGWKVKDINKAFKNIRKVRKKPEVKKINNKNKKTNKKEQLSKSVKMREEKFKAMREKAIKRDHMAYLKTNIANFDDLFRNGLPKSSSILIEGGPGSGKTLFCLHLAYNMCKQGFRTLFMSFEEPPEKLKQHMNNFGLNVNKFEEQGLFKLRRFNALDIARSVEALLSEAKKELLIEIQPVLIPKDFKPDIVIIDSLSAIASAFSGEESRFRIYMEQLFRYLESNDITSFLIRECSNPGHIGQMYVEKSEAISFLSDGIIALYSVIYPNAKRGRAIEVLKMRGEDIKRIIVEMDIINKKGCVVYPNKKLKGTYKLT